MVNRVLFFLFSIFITYLPNNTHNLTASHHMEESSNANYYDKYSTPWVDSVFHSMSLEERIAQLLMIRVHTDKKLIEDETLSDMMLLQLFIKDKEPYYDSISNIIEEYNVGGIAFFSGNAYNQVKITNRLQKKASTPLLVAMDAEWGLGMRLENTISFPYQMTLGALQDDHLIYEMGIEIARQLRRIGVHINFAPVADVNSNPLNPVINFRSFGECRYNVTNKSMQYMMGMQDWGIIANVKHFPGHGDTYTDSHFTLPVIEHDHTLIDSVHLYPFKQLMSNGLKSVMTAHLHIPTYDATTNLAATLSQNVVTNLLQNEIGFQGLVITDALDMKGVSDYFEPGELELNALKAGNDILLLPEDVPAAINTIKDAIKSGEIPEHYVYNKCKKVLFYKEMVGLNNYAPVSEKNIENDINTTKGKLLNKKLIENSITLIKNQNDLLPLKLNNFPNIASIAIGADTINAFQTYLDKFYPVDSFVLPRIFNNSNTEELKEKMQEYDKVIISLHNNSIFANSKYGITDEIIDFIENISSSNNVILNVLANPYVLQYFTDINDIESILISYQDGTLYEEISAQIITGGLPAKGKLPVSISPEFNAGTGIITPSGNSIRFPTAEEAGTYQQLIQKVDSIVDSGIEKEAYPGAQVVVIKDGSVIINNAYGHHTYTKEKKVKNTDIYDVASLTKIAATTAAIMHLKDNGLIDIDKTFDDYLPWLKESNLAGISLRNALAHQGRLHSWIPFHLKTVKNGNLDPIIYSNQYSEEYPVEVAENLFIHKNYRDTIILKIMDKPLNRQGKYLYSDLGFIMFAEIVNKVSGMTIDQYVAKHFYEPLGVRTLTYKPLEKFDKDIIVPSENDKNFRNQILQGYVNDPTAAMLGGVSGHAGLFSNALDMAILMQMFMQNGMYAGKQYISKETISKFVDVQFPENNNRRGLGFDKPHLNDNNRGVACKSASPESFGHSGFTGTFAWADPKENLVFVFISNRVYPDQSNRKLIDMKIRTDIHQAIYDALNESKYLESYKLP